MKKCVLLTIAFMIFLFFALYSGTQESQLDALVSGTLVTKEPTSPNCIDMVSLYSVDTNNQHALNNYTLCGYYTAQGPNSPCSLNIRACASVFPSRHTGYSTLQYNITISGVMAHDNSALSINGLPSYSFIRNLPNGADQELLAPNTSISVTGIGDSNVLDYGGLLGKLTVTISGIHTPPCTCSMTREYKIAFYANNQRTISVSISPNPIIADGRSFTFTLSYIRSEWRSGRTKEMNINLPEGQIVHTGPVYSRTLNSYIMTFPNVNPAPGSTLPVLNCSANGLLKDSEGYATDVETYSIQRQP